MHFTIHGRWHLAFSQSDMFQSVECAGVSWRGLGCQQRPHQLPREAWWNKQASVGWLICCGESKPKEVTRLRWEQPSSKPELRIEFRQELTPPCFRSRNVNISFRPEKISITDWCKMVSVQWTEWLHGSRKTVSQKGLLICVCFYLLHPNWFLIQMILSKLRFLGLFV